MRKGGDKDDLLLKLDAMKMENPLLTTADGVVKEIRVKEGDDAETGDVLVVLEQFESLQNNGMDPITR